MTSKIEEVRRELVAVFSGENARTQRATHKDLAKRLRTSQTMVSNVLARMEEEGSITRDRSKSLITYHPAVVQAAPVEGTSISDPAEELPYQTPEELPYPARGTSVSNPRGTSVSAPAKVRPTPLAEVLESKETLPRNIRILTTITIILVIGANAYHLGSKAQNFQDGVFAVAQSAALSFGAVLLITAGGTIWNRRKYFLGSLAYAIGIWALCYNILASLSFTGSVLEYRAINSTHTAQEQTAQANMLEAYRKEWQALVDKKTPSVVQAEADAKAACPHSSRKRCNDWSANNRSQLADAKRLEVVVAEIEKRESTGSIQPLVVAGAGFDSIAGLVNRFTGGTSAESSDIRLLFLVMLVLGLDFLMAFGYAIANELER